jgi:hypothetical protein
MAPRIGATRRFVWPVVGLYLGSITGCASPTASAPSPPVATADPGPPPPIPTTEGATLTLSDSGVSLTRVRIFQGSRVTFINRDVTAHDIQSNPLHVHTDCPALNSVGFLTPGQSRDSGPLQIVRGCGFHDHVNEGNVRFMGPCLWIPDRPHECHPPHRRFPGMPAGVCRADVRPLMASDRPLVRCRNPSAV